MDEVKGRWVDELPHVLWAYAPRLGDQLERPLFDDIKVVIPLETRFPTMRTNQFNSNKNEQFLSTSLDLVEERREVTIVQLVYYQQKLR